MAWTTVLFLSPRRSQTTRLWDVLDRAFGKPVDHVDLSVDVREAAAKDRLDYQAAQNEGE